MTHAKPGERNMRQRFLSRQKFSAIIRPLLPSNSRVKAMGHARISTDPAIMMGKPCIKGTRITVELILRKLGNGRSFSNLLEACPKLTEEDLREALAFAADYMEHETGSPQSDAFSQTRTSHAS